MRLSRSKQHASVAALAALGLLLLGVALAVRRLGDFDLPFHLAYGRLLASAHHIVRTDDLAYTHRRIQYAEFLSDFTFYEIMRISGALGVQIAGALVVVATAAVLLFETRDAGPVGVLVVALCTAAMNAWLIVRPALLSFFLLAVLSWLLETHRWLEDRARANRLLIALVPLQLVWVNVHGFAVLGAAIALGYLGYRALVRLARGRWPALLPPRDGRDLGRTAWVVAAALGATFVNMAGPRFLLAPFLVGRDFAHDTEWMSASLRFLSHDEPVAGALLVVALAALFFGRDRDTGKRLPTLYDLGLFVLALLLGRSAVRLIPLSAVLLAPICARRLSAFVPPTRLLQWVSPLSLALAAGYVFLFPGTSIGVGFEPTHFPEGAVRYIETARPAGHMYDFLPYGGYLSWRLYPRYRVLIDGRTAWVHDPRVTREARAASEDPRAFRALVRRFDIQWGVTRATEHERFGVPMAGARDFTMVYWDDNSAVYVKNDGNNRRLAAEGYRVLTHLTPLGAMLEAALAGRRAADLAHDATLAEAQAPLSPRAAFIAGCGALAIRDGVGVELAARRLNALAPGHPAVRVLLRAWQSLKKPR
jgi:hypothetical protein